MLRGVRQLQQFAIRASDGNIGGVTDFYFDDERWAVRYLVVDTGKWLPGKRVLISPHHIAPPDWTVEELQVVLSRDQVKSAPETGTHKPVARREEIAHYFYYGLSPYWTGPALWGAAPYPMVPSSAAIAEMDRYVQEEHARASAQGDEHLRSTREVIGYVLHARDGELGTIDDFLVEDRSWAIRYLVINTSQWWFGKRVLIPPTWITSVEWAKQTAYCRVTRQQVKESPTYDRANHLDRQWEVDYYHHYGVSPYWDSETPPGHDDRDSAPRGTSGDTPRPAAER
jgi:hypothetical protein